MYIPDYLIYDEIKRRRQQEEADTQRQKHLELPLYRPEPKTSPPPERDSQESDRGVVIIDLNDWIDAEED